MRFPVASLESGANNTFGKILTPIQFSHSFLTETKFDLTTTNPPLRCRYLSNYKDDINFACADLPIIFGSGLRFPLDWRTYASGKFEKSNDEKDLLQGRIKELEGRVEFLENTLREMLRP